MRANPSNVYGITNPEAVTSQSASDARASVKVVGIEPLQQVGGLQRGRYDAGARPARCSCVPVVWPSSRANSRLLALRAQEAHGMKERIRDCAVTSQ